MACSLWLAVGPLMVAIALASPTAWAPDLGGMAGLVRGIEKTSLWLVVTLRRLWFVVSRRLGACGSRFVTKQISLPFGEDRGVGLENGKWPVVVARGLWKHRDSPASACLVSVFDSS